SPESEAGIGAGRRYAFGQVEQGSSGGNFRVVTLRFLRGVCQGKCGGRLGEFPFWENKQQATAIGGAGLRWGKRGDGRVASEMPHSSSLRSLEWGSQQKKAFFG
ncbi:MAG TPA: hypothetical protein VMT56_00100, partial [Candidatus Bathyarchaeia archaeon]|nr:hypothetical protein [Candidatus Bathyarchaeia archaeon]